MNFTFDHFNFNVLDLERSLSFYRDALGFEEKRRYDAPDGSFILIYVGDKSSNFLLELTWLKDRKEPYNLGESEFHLAITTDDFDAAYKHHREMNCICYENKEMGIYFIMDPDGYWVEILPRK